MIDIERVKQGMRNAGYRVIEISPPDDDGAICFTVVRFEPLLKFDMRVKVRRDADRKQDPFARLRSHYATDIPEWLERHIASGKVGIGSCPGECPYETVCEGACYWRR